jgi:hypothetical protein
VPCGSQFARLPVFAQVDVSVITVSLETGEQMMPLKRIGDSGGNRLSRSDINTAARGTWAARQRVCSMNFSAAPRPKSLFQT